MAEKDEDVLIIGDREYVKIDSVPGEGFETKEEEEKFIQEYISSLDNQDKYDIYNINPNSKYKS